jgi:hypothetical protein
MQKLNRKLLKIIINAPFSVTLHDLFFKLEAFKIPKQKEALTFHVECTELFHESLTLGYRSSLDGKVITY